MDVFFSWSGIRSHEIAKALSHWLKMAMRSIEPWLSSYDIEQGARWNESITDGLNKSKAGVICLTRSNLDKPSVVFEAGALSRSITGTRVYTLLSDLEPSDLSWPLAQFQATRISRDELFKMCKNLNTFVQQSGESAIPDDVFEEIFNTWWPALEKALAALPIEESSDEHRRSDRALLEEILELLRAQNRSPVKVDVGIPNWNDLKTVIEQSTESGQELRWPGEPVEFTEVDLQKLGHYIASELKQSGHATAATLIASADWHSRNGQTLVYINARRTMLCMVLTNEARGIIRRSLVAMRMPRSVVFLPQNWNGNINEGVRVSADINRSEQPTLGEF